MIPDNSEHHTRRRENLKSHTVSIVLKIENNIDQSDINVKKKLGNIGKYGKRLYLFYAQSDLSSILLK
jgi:hypothetical protein